MHKIHTMLPDLILWWESKEVIEQGYWMIAFPASLMFLFIMITSFFKSDTDTSVINKVMEIDTDEGIGFRFITLESLVIFFLRTGIASIKSGREFTFANYFQAQEDKIEFVFVQGVKVRNQAKRENNKEL